MRKKAAMAWVLLQVLVLAGWALREQARFGVGEGRSILVKVQPVDPRDYLRGQYLALAYDFTRFQPGFADGMEVWALLGPSGPYHELRRVLPYRPERIGPGEVALRGRMDGWRNGFGVEKYFVPEGTPTPSWQDTTVRLRVGPDGAARIEQVYVKGVPWP